MERDISHILFADIRGYSRLSNKELNRFHGEVMPVLAQRLEAHGWNYANTWGDALVLSGKSARTIANLALEFRDFFRNYDWQAGELPPLDVRISLHSGEHFKGSDPFTRNGQIVGATVILAARIEPITLPGQIWVTEEVALAIAGQDAEDQRRFGLDDLGKVELPKDYGVHRLFLLRRRDEPQPTAEAIERIVGENSRRRRAERDAPPERTQGKFTAAVGVVQRANGDVVLVKRRQNGEGLDWMFPSGVVLPLQEAEYRVWREVKVETGLSCVVVKRIGERVHPRTGTMCEYFLLEPLVETALCNGDPDENADVRWIPAKEVAKFVKDDLYDEIERLLAG